VAKEIRALDYQGLFYFIENSMNLGEFNKLKVDELTVHGAYLIGLGENRVLLPNKFVEPGLKQGDEITVFLYTDSEDRPVATTQKPLLEIGRLAYLEVVGTSSHGAFLGWGLDKDLFIPFKNQKSKMVAGERYFVTMYVDDFSDRLVATERIGFLFEKSPDIEVGQAYKALVYEETLIGYKIYCERPCRGMVYKNELPAQLQVGDEITVYLKNVRDDGKFDFKPKIGDSHYVKELATKIEQYLLSNGGKANINDKSDPAEIAGLFGCSKKDYKKAIGFLYRNKIIGMSDSAVFLAPAAK
jgi:uncharacterized protein